MFPNFIFVALAALIPLVVGFIWYHEKVFGTAWMKASGVTKETAESANKPLIFGLTYVFSFFAALALYGIVIHQAAIYSILINEPGFGEAGSAINTYITEFMDLYGNNFRTFGHGSLHGSMTGVFLVLPVIAVNALFEHRGFKYIAINAGFWIVCLAIMGGIICQFG